MAIKHHEKVYIIREKSIQKLGFEKALIFDNLVAFDKFSRIVGKKDELYKMFPFFEKKKFYRLLNQLVKSGLVEGSND